MYDDVWINGVRQELRAATVEACHSLDGRSMLRRDGTVRVTLAMGPPTSTWWHPARELEIWACGNGVWSYFESASVELCSTRPEGCRLKFTSKEPRTVMAVDGMPPAMRSCLRLRRMHVDAPFEMWGDDWLEVALDEMEDGRLPMPHLLPCDVLVLETAHLSTVIDENGEYRTEGLRFVRTWEDARGLVVELPHRTAALLDEAHQVDEIPYRRHVSGSIQRGNPLYGAALELLVVGEGAARVWQELHEVIAFKQLDFRTWCAGPDWGSWA